MSLDIGAIYQGQSQPDIGQIYGTALKIKQLQTEQQTQNALKQIFTNPDNVNDDGTLKGNAVKQLMSVAPAEGEKYLGLESQIEERKALTEDRREKEFRDLDNFVQTTVRTPATDAYQEAIKKGMTPEAAQEAGQKVYDEGISELKSSGRFGQDQVGSFDPHFDPARVATRTKMNALANAPKSGDVETITDAQGNTFDHNKLTGKNAFVSGPAGLKKGADYDPSGGVHRIGGASDVGGLDDEGIKYYAQLFRTQGPTALGRLQKADRDKIINEASKEAGGDATTDVRTQYALKGAQAEQRALGTRTGQLVLAEREMEGAVKLSHDAYTKLPRGQFVPFNELQNLYEKKTSSPEQAAAYAADNAIVNIYARMISPTGQGTDSDKNHAREMLNQAQGPEAHEAVLNQLMAEGKNAAAKAHQAQAEVTAETPVAKRPGENVPAPPKTAGTNWSRAVSYLRSHPDQAAAFDARYGKGSAESILGQ